MGQPSSITILLRDWSNGNEAALAELVPLVQKELHVIARRWLRRDRRKQTLQPTVMINEMYVRLIGQSQPPRLESRTHFYGIASRLMRLYLVDYIRTHNAEKRRFIAVPLDEVVVASGDRPWDVLELDELLSRLAEWDERKAKVIEMRCFGEMTVKEIATACGLTVSTVKRDLRMARSWLKLERSRHS